VHALTKILLLLCKQLGLPEWCVLIVLVPIFILAGVGAALWRRKYFQVLKRKIKPYGGTLHHGLCFWAPTARFSVDGIPGELPWCSFLGYTRVRFSRLPAAGRLVVDTNPVSGRGERLAFPDKIFSVRFQGVGAPGSFASAVLDDDTRRRLMKLLAMSRLTLDRGRVDDHFYSGSSPKGRVRLEIDGKSMVLSVKAHLGTKEVEEFLEHAAMLCRKVRQLSAPAAAPR
jgi:hypothetical protein